MVLLHTTLFIVRTCLKELVSTVVLLSLVGCQSNQPATNENANIAGPAQTLEHAMGTIEVPAMPERVVVVDTAPLDAALALGIEPIGTITYGAFPSYLEEDHLQGKASDIAVVGEGNQPNLESIIQLQPDLILGTKTGASRGLYQRLSQIAPTVFTEDSGRNGDWPENFRLYAAALGQSEQAEQLLQRYQEQVDQLRTQIEQPQGIEISVLYTYSGRVGAYTTQSFSGSALQDVGLSRTPAQDLTNDYALEFSAEALDQLNGDYIFLVHYLDFPGSLLKEDFVNNPVWSQLEAVRQNRVCEVPGAVWAAGRSLLAAQQI